MSLTKEETINCLDNCVNLFFKINKLYRGHGGF
jgi:hypothetical protein